MHLAGFGKREQIVRDGSRTVSDFNKQYPLYRIALELDLSDLNLASEDWWHPYFKDKITIFG
jgi:hypothetical protein